MKQINLSLPKVIYRTDQPKKDGSNTFCLQLHLNGKKKQFTLMANCTPALYDKKNNRVGKAHPFYAEFNNVIETELGKACTIILNARVIGEQLTMNEFENRYRGIKEQTSNTDFYAFVAEEIELQKKGVGNKEKETIKKNCNQFNKLKRYKPKLDFNDITVGFLADYEEYMRVKLGNQKSSLNNSLRFIRKFLNEAKRKEITSNYPFKNYQIKDPISDKIKRLETEELDKIKAYYKSLSSKHKHYKTLKSFLFCCYTGLRYGDGKRFKIADVINNCIEVTMGKTKKTTYVPLLQAPNELINYDLDINMPNLDTPCNQTSNRALKQVAKICNINKPLTTHYARHTFGTTAVNIGVPREVVQAVMGHSTSKQTDHYAKLNHTTKIREMAKLENVF